MGRQSQELESIFRKWSKQQILKPSARVLQRLKLRLWVSDFFSFNLRKINIVYSVILAGGVASGILFTQKSLPETDVTANEPALISENEAEKSIEQNVSDDKKSIQAEEENIASSKEVMLMANFDVNTLSGCAPFEVNFTDRSVLADSWHWDFGTGDYSDQKNPEYIFKNPGIYKVTLRISNKNGQEDVSYREIEVLKRPVALLDIDKDNSGISDRKIVFKNSSEGAAAYLWDFGDSKQSVSAQPSHIYNDFGVYKVKLIARSNNGCSDTALLINRFIDQNYELSFATTFRPNPFDKSNNGFYETAGNEAFIFYPTNYGAKTYSLTIYTSNGNKVFETHSIKQGWNGYIGGSLAPAGYYNYLAKGTYPNGKTFEVKGRVKVIIDDYYYKF